MQLELDYLDFALGNGRNILGNPLGRSPRFQEEVSRLSPTTITTTRSIGDEFGAVFDKVSIQVFVTLATFFGVGIDGLVRVFASFGILLLDCLDH